jgi:hypothetical protein
MRLPPIATLVIGGTLYVGLLLAAKGAMFPNKQPLEPFRGKITFCSLLQREINLNVSAGLVTKEEAERIIARCFNSY